MARTRCEICARAEPAEPSTGRIRRILVETRLLKVCEAHARSIQEAGITTLSGLLTLLKEASGRRSLLDRRALLNRRSFPPRPEGRRRGSGRRASDLSD